MDHACATHSGRECLRTLRYASINEDWNSKSYGSVTEFLEQTPVGGNMAKQSQCCSDPMRGTLFAALAGVLIAVAGIAVKYLPEYNIAELVLYQSISSAIFALPLAIPVWKVPFNLRYFSFLLVCSISVVVCNIARYGAIQRLPLGDANAIIFNTPIVTSIMARIILKEKITRLTILSLIISLGGLILTVKLPVILSSPDFSEKMQNKEHLIGCVYAIISLLTISLAVVLSRKLAYVKPVINMFFQGLMGIAISSCFIPLFGGLHIPECSRSSYILVAFSIAMFLNITIAFTALRLQESCLVTITLRSSEIFLSFVAQVTIFKEPIDIYSGFGATLVIFPGLFVPLQHWMQSLPDDSPWKLTWWLK